MGAKEAAIILDLVRDLKQRGDVSIIMIAHNYGQVLEICDRVNLLQHGQITLDKTSKDTSVQELNDIVVAEYRRALEERQRSSADGCPLLPTAAGRIGSGNAGTGRRSGPAAAGSSSPRPPARCTVQPPRPRTSPPPSPRRAGSRPTVNTPWLRSSTAGER